MSRDRWLRILRIVAVLTTTVGCAQQPADEPSPIADDAAAAASDDTILDDGNAKPDVELASAESSVPEVNEEDPSSLNSTINEITLRDANNAMEMIARFFPIRDMQLEYVGVLSNPERSVRFEGSPHPPSP